MFRLVIKPSGCTTIHKTQCATMQVMLIKIQISELSHLISASITTIKTTVFSYTASLRRFIAMWKGSGTNTLKH